jgi:outer membrane receptor protein involved in Fe transport
MSDLDGSVSVKEAFGEIGIPLLRDLPFAKSVDLNAAFRQSKYSRIDAVSSWKVGLSYSIVDGLRLRATRSRDIRAANLGELFSAQSIVTEAAIDPRDNQLININTLFGGNPDLKPELGDTWTAGVILQPHFLRGFSASVDFYSIKIKDAIATVDSQSILDRCFIGGEQPLCDQITIVDNVITDVRSTLINLDRFRTRGIDFETSYSTHLVRQALARFSSRAPLERKEGEIERWEPLSRSFSKSLGPCRTNPCRAAGIAHSLTRTPNANRRPIQS